VHTLAYLFATLASPHFATALRCAPHLFTPPFLSLIDRHTAVWSLALVALL
jgi:hypothetical protein